MNVWQEITRFSSHGINIWTLKSGPFCIIASSLKIMVHLEWITTLFHYLLALSADILYKQFGPRSTLSGNQLFDNLMVFLKEFFKERWFWRKKGWWKKHKNRPACKKLTLCPLGIFKINFFEIFFQEYHQSVKQFGSRSGPTFCRAWSGSKLFAKVISR